MSLPRENARKVICDHGHPLAEENLLVVHRTNGQTERVCRICARRRVRKHHARHYVPHPRYRKLKLPTVRWVGEPGEFGARSRRHARVRRPAYLRVLDRTKIIEDGCWLWQGAVTKGGYGVVQLGRGLGTARTHRVIYEHFIGPIPESLTLDHLCFEPSCCNPGHLEPVTRAENTRRQNAAGHGRAKRPLAQTRP